ncbi:ubiquitin-like FUBI-ribosomal protein eS30 fusion protein [Neocloeon triangulifer]|uniref:ubiquitin-like FUBI-ribosomal protein eS30 fusion protein n=1 Tax=Neocloeon triangulifer TaxID=2078957 RepID=UPI00286F09B4|nr:ubiquitin-like FUBI-ribosomal protein eS30 fusion protein [Neocloeon triangulifer]
MQLFVRGLSTQVLEVSSDETVGQIRSRLLQAESVEGELLLSCEGVPLEDSLTAGSLLCPTLDANVSVKGGKVHGSLARAGKVKGQTPRVEKGEKKKKKTGRAKRRIQYNRRFVNVVQGFGRRRGPNANS